MASCSLNLDWDDDSNPIEVWQCSTLRQLRICAQLPLQAGQFRPARLAALQALHIAGCCHMPAYFAQALATMREVGGGQGLKRACTGMRQGARESALVCRRPGSPPSRPLLPPRPAQLSSLKLTDCLPSAVMAVPWHLVLPALPVLRELAVERCPGAALLPELWRGLALCSQLRRLAITGGSAGGGIATSGPQAVRGAAPCCAAAAAHPEAPPCMHQAAPAAAVPGCIALLQQLRALDLSNDGLRSLPDCLAWCQQLTDVRLSGNLLPCTPPGLAMLGGLRKLDLSFNQVCAPRLASSQMSGPSAGAVPPGGVPAPFCNRSSAARAPSQLSALAPGPYLRQLEDLDLGGNLLLHPMALPLQLLQHSRLRRVALPAWWHLLGGDGVAVPRLMQALLPWLLLESC